MAKGKSKKSEKRSASKKSVHLSKVEIGPPPEPPEPKPLSQEALHFYTYIQDPRTSTVPPISPAGIEHALIIPFPIPETFPSLDNFELPYVREVGIKTCIDQFGMFLNCPNYNFDYIQFWFLDVLTDCLWRTQDDYSFTKPEQKLVLEWVLYMFRVMRDPNIFYSRRQFFKLFKEAILLAGQIVQEGHKFIPKPEDLFEIVFAENHVNDNYDPEDTSESTDTTRIDNSESTFLISKESSQHIVVMNVGGLKKEYILRRKTCSCDKEESDTSSGETYTSDMSSNTEDENEYISETLEEEEKTESTTEEQIDMSQGMSKDAILEPFQNKNYKNFHNPDTSVPVRFLSFPEGNTTEKSNLIEEPNRIDQLDTPCQIIGDVLLLDNRSIGSSDYSNVCLEEPDKNAGNRVKKEEQQPLTDIEKVKLWQKYKQYEQEQQDMNDSKVGVVPYHHHHHGYVDPYEKPITKSESSHNTLSIATENMLKRLLQNITEQDSQQEMCGLDIDYKTKNLSILCAIIDLVFDYFYQNFHFTLLKLALKTTPAVLIQKINTDWSVPKQNFQELVKPKLEKVKKEKGKKDKKNKKSKPSKDKKKSKDKSSKKSKKDSDKKKKKEKKDKKKKPSKEELKRLKQEKEKERLLQLQLEEEKRKQEENRRFMFSLADAADDELYKGLFENWERPAESTKHKKADKTKGGKKKKK